LAEWEGKEGMEEMIHYGGKAWFGKLKGLNLKSDDLDLV